MILLKDRTVLIKLLHEQVIFFKRSMLRCFSSHHISLDTFFTVYKAKPSLLFKLIFVSRASQQISCSKMAYFHFYPMHHHIF